MLRHSLDHTRPAIVTGSQAWRDGLLVLCKLERRVGSLRFAEREGRPLDIDFNAGALRDLAPNDRLGQGILDVLLDRPP